MRRRRCMSLGEVDLSFGSLSSSDSVDSEMASSSSLLPPNPLVNSDVSSIRRKRKRRVVKESRNETANLQSISETQWRSEAQQQVYSSKLLRALRQVRLGGGSSGNQTVSSKQVRNAADRVLSATARGRSRWSRAIISSPIRLKSKKLPRNIAISKAQGGKSSRLRNKSRSKANNTPPAFQRKAGLLGRLIPGCRKQPLPVILEETIDYIPALEMQVRAMSSLLEVLSANANGSSSNMAVDNGHL